MDAIEKLKATVVSPIEERNTLREDRDRLIEEAKDLMVERDEARQEAWRWRSLYCFTSTELESEYPFPWEEKS